MMRSLFLSGLGQRTVLAALVCLAIPMACAAQSQGRAHAPARQPARPGPAAAAPAAGATATAAPPKDEFVDGIAAVVNKDVITLREVNDGVQAASAELTRQHIELPPAEALQRQVLQRLIMQTLQRQEAERMRIRVDDAQVDKAIASVADRNKLSVDQLRQAVGKEGIPWAEYRKNIRAEVLADRLRQRAVDSSLVVSDAEIDAFLKEQQRRQGGASAAPGRAPSSGAPAATAAAPSGPQVVSLGQILVRVPESATPEQMDTLRRKAEDILARLKNGGDFANIAAAASDGPEALQGGDMGERPMEGWPDLFVNAIADMPKGSVSEIIQSGNGFHILKVLDRHADGAPAARGTAPAAPARGPVQPGSDSAIKLPQGSVEVTQTHARHILIKTSAVMSDEQARQRLELLRQRIVEGHEDFATLARQSSQDATAPQGGDLDWLNPGETVPEFESVMNALKPGEISPPVQSRFGWHLIQVLDRRKKDVKDDLQRLQARRVLFERRSELAFEDYLEQLRDSAYIDNRLEKQAAQEKGTR